MSNEDAIVIDTHDGIAHFRMLQVIGALHLETKGLKMSRGSIMNMARREYSIDKRTKAGVLADLRKQYQDTYGHECQIGMSK